MATYTVKNGENLYDIALKLFGSIEGIFSLLAYNQDAISESGLSLDQTIEAGTNLEYSEDSIISRDVIDDIAKSGVNVKNGELNYSYYRPETYITSYVKSFNVGVVKKSFTLFPEILDNPDASTIDKYLSYLNTNCVWTERFVVADIEILAEGDYAKAETITVPSNISKPKLIIKQSSGASILSYRIKQDSVILIDWGDNETPSMCPICESRRTETHVYADDGSHIITIYGDFEFTYLDLSEVGGIYYPLSKITVDGYFFTKYPNDTTINRLINVT